MNCNKEFVNELLINITKEFTFNYEDILKLECIMNGVLQNYYIGKNEVMNYGSDVADKLSMFLQAKKLDGVTEGTLKNYFYFLSKLPLYTNKSVKDISLNDLRGFLNEYGVSDKVSTSAARIGYIQTFFEWMLDEGMIDKDPSKKLPNLKVPKRLRQSLTLEEIEKLRIACDNNRERALLEVFLATGCRRDEVCKINITDLNFSNNSLNVIGKGNKERKVYFNDKTKVHIQNYLAERKDNNVALFVTLRKPYKRLEYKGIYNTIRKIGSRAGLEKNIYPHLCRHSLAHLALKRGANITTIQKVLGHSSVQTTEKYLDVDDGNVLHEYNKFMIN